MLENVYLALYIGATSMSGVLVDNTNHIKLNTQFNTHMESNIEDLCIRSIEDTIEKNKYNYNILGVGIAAKGQILSDGTLFLKAKGIKIPLQRSLNSRFNLPISIINRFQASALAIYSIFNLQSKSFALIQISDAVGYGLVKDGLVINSYNIHGSGGLEKIRRKSDGQWMSIVNIVSEKAIQIRTSTKLNKQESFFSLFEKHNKIESEQEIINDVIDAIGELTFKLVQDHSPSVIKLLAYPKSYITRSIKNDFLDALEDNIKSKHFKKIHLEYVSIQNSNFKNEDDIRLIGAAQFSHQTNRNKNIIPTSVAFRHQMHNIFVVTGEPASGKTTFVEQTIFREIYKTSYKIGGIFSLEIRSNNKRIGFETKCFSPEVSSRYYELATIYPPTYFTNNDFTRFSNTPYYVNIYNIKEFIIPHLQFVSKCVDLLIIDELAAMQISCDAFESTIKDIIEHTTIPILFTVPYNTRNHFINHIKSSAKNNGTYCELSNINKTLSQEKAFQGLFPMLLSALATPKVSETALHLEDPKKIIKNVHSNELANIETSDSQDNKRQKRGN